jgi:hypothetical protein
MMILGSKVLLTTDEIAEYIATEPSLGYLRHALIKAIVLHAKPVRLIYDHRWVIDALKLIGFDITK